MADILNLVVGLMSKEEARHFKLYALRSHDEEERKDLQLFDLIRKVADDYDERQAMRQLYGKGARPNTFHRLRNRLLQEIGKSMALLHWEKDETFTAIHELTLAMLHRRRMQPLIAEHYLRRAERRLVRLDLPELLDIVLGEFITLSFELTTIDPARYIQKRNENRRRLNQLWEIDNVLALVNHRLRISQNLGRDDDSITQILRKTVEELSLDPKITTDPKFRLRMYDAVSKILLDQRDYVALEAFLLETYETFTREELFNKNNHDTKLQMLTYIINALFKNGKLDQCLEYSERLRVEMDQFGHFLRPKYELYYYNGLMMVYSEQDYAAAIRVLEAMMQNERIMALPQNMVFIHLNMALMEYAQKQIKLALRGLVKLRLLDAFATTDEGFRLRVELMELALRLESADHETLEYRLAQCKGDHAQLLTNNEMQKEGAFLALVERMHLSAYHRRDEQLEGAIRAFIDSYPVDDTEFFRYGKFLQGMLAAR